MDTDIDKEMDKKSVRLSLVLAVENDRNGLDQKAKVKDFLKTYIYPCKYKEETIITEKNVVRNG